MKSHVTACGWNLLRGLIACLGLCSHGVWAECTDFPTGTNYVTSNTFPVTELNNFVSNIQIPSGATTNQVVRTIDVTYTFTNCQIPHYAGTNGTIMGVQFFNDDTRLPGTSTGAAIYDSNNQSTGLSIRSQFLSHSMTCSGNASLGYAGGKGTWITSNGGASCRVVLTNRHTLYRNALPIQTSVFPGASFSWLSLSYLDANGNFSRWSDWGGSPYIQNSTSSVVQTGTHWDNTSSNSTADGGSGVWNGTNTNWLDSTAGTNGVWQQGATAVFPSAAGTATLADGYTASVSGLTFNASGYTVNATGTGGLSLGSSATVTVGSSGSDLVTIEAPVSGASALTLAGPGRLKLTGNNTYTGATSVTGGVLQIGQGANAGSISSTSSIALSAGTSLVFNRNDLYTLTSPISGAGAVVQDGIGTTVLDSTNTYTGGTWVNAGRLTFKNTTINYARFDTPSIAIATGATLEVNVGSGLEESISTAQVTYTGNGTLEKTGLGLAALSNYSGLGDVAMGQGAKIKVLQGTLTNYWGSFVNNKASLNVATGALFWHYGNTNLRWDVLEGGGSYRRYAGTSSVGELTLGVGNSSGEFSGAVFDDEAGLSLTKVGTGTQTFSGILSFGGGIAITQGAIQIGNGSTTTPPSLTYTKVIGTTTVAGGGHFSNRGMTVNISSGASLILNRGEDGFSDNFVLSGAGMLRNIGAGKVTLTGNNTYTGGTEFRGGILSLGSTGAIGTSGSLQFTGGTLQFTASNTSDYSARFSTLSNQQFKLDTNGQSVTLATGLSSSAGTLTKLGTGTLTLSGASTYGGNTTVSAGTLMLTGSLDSNGATTVASAATLAGTGTAPGSVTVNGSLSPGTTGEGTFNTGSVTFNSGATLTMDLNAPGTTGGAVNDLLVVTGDISLDGALAINKLANFSATGKYTLITYTGTRTGTFSSSNLAAQGYLGVIEYDDTNKQVNLVSLPRVRIAQTTTGGVGTFQFSLSGLASKQLSLTTVTAGVTVTSSYLNGGINTALEVVQTPPSAWSPMPTSVSCIDANGANNGNGSNNIGTLAGSKVVVLASAMKAGSDITCAFANTRNNLSGVVFNDGGAPSAGVNSGTPNDGLPNGGESGQAGVVVSLTNCASTVFSSTVTDNAGAYALNLAPAQSGQTVCVAITLPSKHLATGASAATTALPSGIATTVAGTAYTYTRSSHQVSFTASSSGAFVLNFGMVPESQLIVANDLTAAPGGIATHSHRFTAGTSGTLILTTQNGVSVPAALTGWSEAIYQDATCSGSYVSSAANWSPPNNTMSVTQGQSVCFVVREFVPANAQNGNSYSMQVKAQLNFSNASPSLSASYTVTDITTVSGNVVTLKKQVRNITTGGANAVWKTENAAQSGDVLEYQITFTNTSSAAVTDLVIQDGSPAWTTWTQASSGTVPANMTCTMNTPANPVPQAARACSPTVTGSGTGNLTWKFSGSLQPQVSGSVLFRVTVN